ncbi:M20 family metallopeptidase [Clostridium botulinum]|uniref:M20 family metallopeptidase n=1 Tax=Clostridium botulinum TaxID=1491 RepID=UPI0005EDD88C|nr:M20 family metallopeptidase [Clostridium botulinum]
MDIINKIADEYENYVIDLRRYFHSYPECSWDEKNTSKKIKSELNKFDIPFESIANTGILVNIKGKETGKTVLLRADMDAIQVNECNNSDYVSKNKGIMHACGHDGHMAMLLGAAIVLNNIKDKIKGNIKLLFQPAEEVGEGAVMCIKEDVLDSVDNAFAIHLWSNVPYGMVAIEEGPIMPSADVFKIKIKGKGGHGAMPHETIDSVLAASAFVMSLQSIVSREVDPIEPLIISIGKLQAGSRFNVIANEAIIEGTSRYFNMSFREKLPNIIERILKNSTGVYNAKGELSYKFATPVTINDERSVYRAKQVINKILGEDKIYKMNKNMVTEDFGYYLEKVPGALAFLGVGNETLGSNYPQHHEKYNIDERALKIGVKLYCEYALDFLNC